MVRRSPIRTGAGRTPPPIRDTVEAARNPQRTPIGELLVERGIIDGDALARALAEQRHSGRRLGEILVGWGLISWLSLAQALAAQWPEDFERLRAELGVAPEPSAPAPDRGAEQGFLVFGPTAEGWTLLERRSRLPQLGDTLELGGTACVVTKIARSPLPGDRRRCVYLHACS